MIITYNGNIVNFGGSIINYNDPNQGLLIYLDSTRTSSYVGSGSTWNDISGFDNDATLINNPTFDVNNGGSIVFDDDLFQYGTIPNIGDLPNWTVEVWFKLTSTLSGKCTALVANQFDLTSKLNFSIGTNLFPTNSNICVGFYDGQWRTTTGFVPNTDTWYQVVGTYDGQTIKQYINGVLSGGTVNYIGTPQSGGELRLMRRWDSTAIKSNLVDGHLSIIKIYDRNLSNTEVLNNFNTNKVKYGL
jgi:hypothetical protein